MAPEQIKGAEITPRTDLYALGCVLFEMLTGKPPFAAETPAATLERHCRQPAPRVSEIALDCPAVLDRLVDRMLEKDPARRPQSAVEVARELRSVSQTVTVMPSRKAGGVQATVGNRPVEAPPRSLSKTPSSGTYLSAAPRSAPLAGWTAIAAAVALLVAAAAIPAWWQQRSAAQRWEELGVRTAANADQNVRIAGLHSLGQMSDVSDRAAGAVREAMSDPSPPIRTAAATVAGEAGAAGSVYLTELWLLQRDDPEDSVRSAAAASIRKIETAPPSGGSGWPAVVALLLAVIVASVWYFKLKRNAASKAART
jgi:serine/threonine-protein kinase